MVQNVAGWGLKLEALKVVQAGVQYLARLMAPHMGPLLAQAWHLFLSQQALYQQLVVYSSSDSDLHVVRSLSPCFFHPAVHSNLLLEQP